MEKVAELKHLSKPPLREALIDIRFTEAIQLSDLVGEKPPVIDGFDVVKPIKRGEFFFEIGLESHSKASVKKEEHFGWRYETKDASKVIQLRSDGMAYSILRDYRNWEELKSEARTVWGLFCRPAKPLKVGRLAVRCINVLDLPPQGGIDFDDYLTAGPRVPADLPQGVVGFLHKVAIPFPDGSRAIVTQKLEQQTDVSIPVVLDIDVFLERSLTGESQEVWSLLDALRVTRNMIFFSSVTERALEKYL